jgi:hypothetical protein
MENKKFIVVTCKTPTSYNNDVCYVVEAATPQDAKAIVKDRLRDFGLCNYTYEVREYTPPPAGKIVGTM